MDKYKKWQCRVIAKEMVDILNNSMEEE